MKKDLEVDFSEISLGSKKETTANLSHLTGISLAIPKGKNKFVVRDLAECSNQEFLDWIVFYHPILETGKRNLELFNRIPDRIRYYEDVVRFCRLGNLFIANKSSKKTTSN